ncbi:Hypothetical predicted protein [Olea europaea subsp. europaea]|uniref:SMP domain-containing protein n=1 Tax=Olea europaea subsp. europaea TaxID=158383 RepID=A0A8S0TEX0_OLEEU|nr:Hypothetical predicted protein [Olea europaea subsp. europaea]
MSPNLVLSSSLVMRALRVAADCAAAAMPPAPLAPESVYKQRGNITIGEALEATALTAGHKPVDYSDAAAIQAAEVRATGRANIVPGGIAAAAQSAATRNARMTRDEDKTKLGDILTVTLSLAMLYISY